MHDNPAPGLEVPGPSENATAEANRLTRDSTAVRSKKDEFNEERRAKSPEDSFWCIFYEADQKKNPESSSPLVPRVENDFFKTILIQILVQFRLKVFSSTAYFYSRWRRVNSYNNY